MAAHDTGNAQLETDYLVIGAGAAGMAFTDALLTHSDATVTIVDRRHAPGGHWIDAYPFVRLHQPSTMYGVSSVPLGRDTRDVAGTNAGYYELAGVDEIRTYFHHVMHHHFLPSGRVRYFPSCDYVGDGRFVGRLAPTAWTAKVRRKVVDTTYLEGAIPATSPPPFEVSDGVCCVPLGELVNLQERSERFVVIGAGKTALDACVWLLEQGVPASSMQWIKPRESWWRNRRFLQPYDLFPDWYRGLALQAQAMAQATSIDDLMARLEAIGVFLRIDRDVPATMYRGAVISDGEVELLRTIRDVVRLGHVRRIDRDQIELDGGSIPTSAGTVHVHCASRGLARPPLRPIFESDRITIQPFLLGFACYQYATLGIVEATVEHDDEKNRLCPPVPYWDTTTDYLSSYLAGIAYDRARAAHPALTSWVRQTRLHPLSGFARHAESASVIESRERLKQFGSAAADNLVALLAAERARSDCGAP